MSESKGCREPIWYVLLGAAIATCLAVMYFSVVTEQIKAIHDLGIRNQVQGNPAANNCFSQLNETKNLQKNSTETTFEDLLPVLKNASMEDKTIIFTEVNAAFASPGSLLDLFLESFHSGENIEHLLDHLVMVAVDQVSFEKCKAIHRHCYLLKIDGENFKGNQLYMSKGFVRLVWGKIKLMQQMVELGYNDLDVLWFRNILKLVSTYYDTTLSCDRAFKLPEDIENSPNMGLFYVKSTAKNVEVLNHWYEARNRFPNKNEQMVFNEIKKELVEKFQVKMRFVGTDYLSGFCTYGKDLNEVYTMHSCCCVSLKNKVSDLRGVLDDWKKYKSLSAEEKKDGNFTGTVPRICLRLS